MSVTNSRTAFLATFPTIEDLVAYVTECSIDVDLFPGLHDFFEANFQLIRKHKIHHDTVSRDDLWTATENWLTAHGTSIEQLQQATISKYDEFDEDPGMSQEELDLLQTLKDLPAPSTWDNEKARNSLEAYRETHDLRDLEDAVYLYQEAMGAT